MATDTVTSTKSLSMILKEEPYLCDLHTHLLGMGNANFWIDTILMDQCVMPTHEKFKINQYVREVLCPLVWSNTGSGGFIDGKITAKFFQYLIDKNIFRKQTNDEASSESKDSEKISESVNFKGFEPMSYEDAMKPLREKFPLALCDLVTKELYHDLIHGGLEFNDDFSYDVILTLSDLTKGLGIRKSDCDSFAQLAVIEKLGGHLLDRSIQFKHWIIFNARKQKFEIVYGIQVGQLRELIRIDPNKSSEAAKLARAHLINAFSMCDAEGTRPRPIDFHSFHGFFTPEFYPRRFALKDSIYSQRLDVLAALIGHVMERYRTCSPAVKYCELSVSANDLSKEWVFDVMRSVRIYDETTINSMKIDSATFIYQQNDKLSSFSQIVLNGCFPYLQADFRRSKDAPASFNVTYKFLAGFDRQKIKFPLLTDQDKALHFLYRAPHEAILLMVNEIKKSEEDQRTSEQILDDLQAAYENTTEDQEQGFDPCLKQLKSLRKIGQNVTCFYTWVVGLDLFGDELGYPYCPFVARPFIEFVLEQRANKNKYFGMRIHGGENVKYADDENPAYRLFIAHMYIVFRSLIFLQQKLKYGIRIGHGIAFNRILCEKLTPSRYRKSSVLLAEMHDQAKYLFKKIAFEVNLTSNEYLLGQTLRQADFAQILQLEELFKMKTPIMLATDDDGIWPIDQCSFIHPGHQSLAAEYCRAISTSLINSPENLRWTFETMKKFCFWYEENDKQKPSVDNVTPTNCPQMNTVIVHPHIISLILQEYSTKTEIHLNSALEKFKIYRENGEQFQHEMDWINDYGAKRIAFVCICSKRNPSDKEELRKEYLELFGNPKTPLEEFDFIYDSWNQIYEDFVDCETTRSPKITIEHQNKDKQKKFAIWSIESSSENFREFLESIRWSGKEINIRAYANQANTKEVLKLFENWHTNSNDSDNGTLYLYTNTDKYTYKYSKIDDKFKFRLNPHASKREKTDQNFIYILCHRARAATAALNLISEQLTKLVDAPSTDLLSIVDHVSFGTSIEPPPLGTHGLTTTEDLPQNMLKQVPYEFTLDYTSNKATADQAIRDDDIDKRPHCDNNDDDERQSKRTCITDERISTND